MILTKIYIIPTFRLGRRQIAVSLEGRYKFMMDFFRNCTLLLQKGLQIESW